MEAIDWSTAQRVGEMIAGSPSSGGVRAAAVEPLAREFAERVAAYSGLELHRELPALEAVDRREWIAANLKSMRPLLAPLTERLNEDKGRLAGPMRAASGLALGAQVGALTGMLSQRVLGQYDLALLDETVAPRLLLLAPNLAQAAQNLHVDRDELVLWVTIHEITHAVQFSGTPWLREHMGSMIRELIDGLQAMAGGKKDDEQEDGRSSASRFASSLRDGLSGLGGLSRSAFDTSELRSIVERARQGQFLRLTLGEDRWQLVERMQAAMSLIEGHAEHTMDVIGADVLPSLPQLRAAMNRRRTQRGLPWRVLERLLGLELKMRQYEVGRRFCDEVVRLGGPQTLALAWSEPAALPSTQELEQPRAWVERMQGGSADKPEDPTRTHVPPVTN
jgi:coenzyme F420 biosynthesis associated uncharacterized protein